MPPSQAPGKVEKLEYRRIFLNVRGTHPAFKGCWAPRAPGAIGPPERSQVDGSGRLRQRSGGSSLIILSVPREPKQRKKKYSRLCPGAAPWATCTISSRAFRFPLIGP